MDNAYLEITERKGSRQVPLDSGPLTIGRNFTNLLVIEEPMASRFHCVIEKLAEGFIVRDLESRNGTILNGQPVRGEAPMAPGDVLKIGKTEMKLMITAARSARGMPGKSSAAAADTAMNEFAELVHDSDEAEEPDEVPAEAPPANEYERQLREKVDALSDKTFNDRQDRRALRAR